MNHYLLNGPATGARSSPKLDRLHSVSLHCSSQCQPRARRFRECETGSPRLLAGEKLAGILPGGHDASPSNDSRGQPARGTTSDTSRKRRASSCPPRQPRPPHRPRLRRLSRRRPRLPFRRHSRRRRRCFLTPRHDGISTGADLHRQMRTMSNDGCCSNDLKRCSGCCGLHDGGLRHHHRPRLRLPQQRRSG